MRFILFAALASLIGCSETSRFGVGGDSSVSTGIAWNGAPALTDADGSAGGAYALGLAGPNLTVGSTITLEIIDDSTGSSLFTGDFLEGDDLGSATPTNTSGSANFATDLQPYFDAGSVLSDGSTVTFRKRLWAESNGQFQSLFVPTNPVLDW